MRIAQIAPLTEAIPPKLYGGTERVIYWLTEELVALGHDVTLFASGDSPYIGPTLCRYGPRWFLRGTFDPAFTSESSMLSHKFHIGQLVQLAPAISRNVPGGSYEITKKLPESRGDIG
jgi:hypothetical protein